MIEIRGKVSSGLKEAELFMKKEIYMNQYEKKLGFIPYLGTLNINVDYDITHEIDIIKKDFEIINGDENVGSVYFIKSTIINPLNNNSREGAILFPSITIYSYETLEFVCDKRLRESLGINDGDEVIIQIENTN